MSVGRQYWVVIGVETEVFWPAEEFKISYKGQELILRPATEKTVPDIATLVQYPNLIEDTILIVRRFLNALSWVENKPVLEICLAGGGIPIRIGKKIDTNFVGNKFRVDYLPDPENDKGMLALAFYREAIGLNSLPYKFLGFYKVINLLHSTGNEQKAWINSAIDKLTDVNVQKRIESIKESTTNVGEYLYVSGRNAVAHAFNEPLVDPNDPKDLSRLRDDLPVMKALAEYFIESELKIKSSITVYREHFYELEGFRNILGECFISKLKNKEKIDFYEIPGFPDLSFRLRGYKKMQAFEDIKPEIAEIVDGIIILRCTSENNLVRFPIGLDFVNERLNYDVNKILIIDNGSIISIEHAINYFEFIKGLVLNGEFEVWDSNNELLLGRLNPNIPVNIDLDATIKNLDSKIDELKRESDFRKMEKECK